MNYRRAYNVARVLAACTCVVASGVAQAAVQGGTNLGTKGYPSVDCRKPKPPTRTYGATREEIERYNIAVDSYNTDLQRFIACTREYIQNAQNDVKRIRALMDEAVERAKR
jgi:hypothetical protein